MTGPRHTPALMSEKGGETRVNDTPRGNPT
jgi:hypothetical protein